MSKIKEIFIGSDHNGFDLKERLIKYLQQRGYKVNDVSNRTLDPDDDFPEFAAKAVNKVLDNDNSIAILLCGGGQGMCMAANRFKGIRASVLWDSHEAKMTRNDNDANVCCLPARIVSKDDQLWKEIVDTFIDTPFAGASRFIRRNNQIDNF